MRTPLGHVFVSISHLIAMRLFVTSLYLSLQPARRAAFKNNGSEEYQRILEVVERYALHHAARGVGFTCKKVGETSPDLHVAGRTATLDAIGAVFGHALKRELLPVSASAGPSAAAGAADSSSTSSASAIDGGMAVEGGEEPLTFTASGYVSNANYSRKKGVFILFINDRLVDCGPLRKALEAQYADILPKGGHPFIYLSLTLPTDHVDVNVHPTKREVAFLHSDELIGTVAEGVAKALQGANASRTFYTQTLLPLAAVTPAGTCTVAGDVATGAVSVSDIIFGTAGGGEMTSAASIVRAATDRVMGISGGGSASAGHPSPSSSSSSSAAVASGGRFGAGVAAFAAAYAASSSSNVGTGPAVVHAEEGASSGLNNSSSSSSSSGSFLNGVPDDDNDDDALLCDQLHGEGGGKEVGCACCSSSSSSSSSRAAPSSSSAAGAANRASSAAAAAAGAANSFSDQALEDYGIDSLLRPEDADVTLSSTNARATRDGVHVNLTSSGNNRGATSGARARGVADDAETDPSVKVRQQPGDGSGGGDFGGWTISYLQPELSLTSAAAAPNNREASTTSAAAKLSTSASSSSSSAAATKAPNKTVRVDTSHRALDVYLQPLARTQQQQQNASSTSASNMTEADDDGIVIDDEREGITSALAPPAVLTDADVSLSLRRASRSSGAMQPVRLISVREVLSAIDSDKHAGLALLLPKLVYVGTVDGQTSLVQANTKLLLINHVQLTREMVYQQAWRLFANFRPFELAPHVDVGEMIGLCLRRFAGKAAATASTSVSDGGGNDSEMLDGDALLQPGSLVGGMKGPSSSSFAVVPAPIRSLLARNDGDVTAASSELASLLLSKGPMLYEYYAIRFKEVAATSSSSLAGRKRRRLHPMHASAAAGDDDGVDEDEDAEDAAQQAQASPPPGPRVHLTHLPRIIDGHTPQMTSLPDFLTSLALTVNWTAEKPCFHGIAQNLANFYAVLPPMARATLEAVVGAAAPGSEQQYSTAVAAASAANSAAAKGGNLNSNTNSASNSGSSNNHSFSTGGGDSDFRLPRTPTAASASASAPWGPGSLPWTVEHVLVPAFRKVLSAAPPRKLGAGHYVVQVAATEQLYRIFERC